MTRWTVVFILFALSIVGSAAFAASYALGLETQWAGGSAFFAFGFLGAALVVWEHGFEAQTERIEEREPLPSEDTTRSGAEQAFEDGFQASFGRARWLGLMLGAAVSAVGAALLFPIRSLGPAVDGELAHTTWKRGLRAVRADGTPVKFGDLEIGSVETVFPEGFVGPDHDDDMANSATMLLRVPPQLLELPPDRAGWAPEGALAYSKVCTHAGCPLGLYRAQSHELFCPCHQSTFDVLTGGTVVFGPAGRPLPQLPLAVRDDGYVIAQSDYTEPIGPGYWQRS